MNMPMGSLTFRLASRLQDANTSNGAASGRPASVRFSRARTRGRPYLPRFGVIGGSGSMSASFSRNLAQAGNAGGASACRHL